MSVLESRIATTAEIYRKKVAAYTVSRRPWQSVTRRSSRAAAPRWSSVIARRKKILARDRIDLLLDPLSPFL